MTRALAFMVFAGCALATTGAQAVQPFAWPDGRKAAVSLAYDDALPSQLDIAAPALKQHGLHATFYLTLANPTVSTRLAEWRAVAADGNELGNHTVFHPCSATGADRSWVTPHRDLDHTPAIAMQDEVRVANAMLHAIDGRDVRTFTPPCGDRLASGKDYVALVAKDFVALRVPGNPVVDDIATLDLAAVPAAAPEGQTGAQLIALVEQAARKGTMVSITFHGVGGDYLATSREAHDALLAHLAAHEDIYWVDTFGAITSYLRQRRNPK